MAPIGGGAIVLAPRVGDGRERIEQVAENHPSQTLSPRPPAPTRFIPSFQSPVPISGRPCAPVGRLSAIARTQCSYTDALSRDRAGRS